MTEMTTSALEVDQAHMDAAWDARERQRRTLQEAPASSAGPRKMAGDVRRSVGRLLEKFAGPEEPVAAGRFDTDAGDRFYVGKQAIHDDDQDLLVISWQTPAAAPFYRASIDDPCGVTVKRTFTLDHHRIVDVDELLFADLARRVEELGEAPGADDALLRDLGRGRTGEMQDIVQTIQAAQYELIRAPLDQLLVIQGGPGTGKTVTALHRVSWLLFNHREELAADQVLVVGPNPTFTRYIKNVLPMLGDQEVQHTDLRNLGPQRSTVRPEEPDTARLKGEERMAGLLLRALRQRVRVADRTDRIEVGQGAGAIRLTADEINAVLPDLLAVSTYSAGRTAMRLWIGDQVRIRAAEARREGRPAPDATATELDAATERVWPSLTPQAFLRDLFGSRDRLLAAAGDEFSAGDIGRLLRAPADRLSDEQWSDTDVALLDEAEALIGGSPISYRHIVVDEAQDLSPMHLRSIRRRSLNGSYTVVGDLAQSTGPWARDSWDDLNRILQLQAPVAIEELSFGYRVPRQVFEFAARLLPFAAPQVTPPTVVRDGPDDPHLLRTDSDSLADQAVSAARDYAGRGLFVGVVCPDQHRAAVIERFGDHDVQWSNVGAGALGMTINLVRPDEAKGLEFDAVVVVEPEDVVATSERGLRLLYIALTRTTRHLTVVHSRSALPLPSATEEPLASEPFWDDEPPPLIDLTDAAVLVPSGRSVTLDLTDLIAVSVAERMAEAIREAAAPALWPRVVEHLHELLAVENLDQPR